MGYPYTGGEGRRVKEDLITPILSINGYFSLIDMPACRSREPIKEFKVRLPKAARPHKLLFLILFSGQRRLQLLVSNHNALSPYG